MVVAQRLWPYSVVVAVTAAMLALGSAVDWGAGVTYGLTCAVLVPVTIALLATNAGLTAKPASARSVALSETEEDRLVVGIAIGVAYRLCPEDTVLVRAVAARRNCGYLDLPQSVLQKPGKLTEFEWEQVKRHPLLGQTRVQSSDDEQAREVASIVRSTHERWDGLGYPDGLAGDEIPLAAQIVSCADAYAAMINSRPYRLRPLTRNEAVAELQDASGAQFNPAVVRTMLEILGLDPPRRAHLRRGRSRGPAEVLRPAGVRLIRSGDR